MQKIKLITAVLILTCSILSQEMFSLKNAPSMAVQNTDTLIIEGKKFEITISSSGNHSIKRISKKSGRAYKQYLGYKTKYNLKGRVIFSNKDNSKYWVLALGRTGYPKKLIVTKNN